ncbi:dihydrofolate reductase [Wenyingzhuangia sp. IMCC45533]
MITLIAAIGQQNELGKDNDLIWHLPADLKRFKKVTSGHYIIMGRNTYESIGKPLPNRTSVIITRNKNYKADGCIVVNSLSQALDKLPKDQNAFIIGGAQIYNEAINIVDVLDICEVHHTFDADVYFPEIDKSIWIESEREKFMSDDKHQYDYSFVKYTKKQS